MKIFILLALLFLSACGTQMKNVLASCEQFKDFSEYAYCIKSTYDNEGKRPNSVSVKAFYANLDEIEENYRLKNITNAQARSQTYNAFMKTIQASNDKLISPTTVCQRTNSNTVICN